MEDGAGHGQTWGNWDAIRSYFWEGEHSLRHSTERQDSPLLFPALLVTEFALGEDFGWDQGMWEPRVRYLGFYSALETSSQVASHSRIAYMNKDDGCSWLRVGAIQQSLYPRKSHSFLSVLLLTQWRFKLSCEYSHSDFQALWALKGICQSVSLCCGCSFTFTYCHFCIFLAFDLHQSFRYLNWSVSQSPQQMDSLGLQLGCT